MSDDIPLHSRILSVLTARHIAKALLRAAPVLLAAVLFVATDIASPQQAQAQTLSSISIAQINNVAVTGTPSVPESAGNTLLLKFSVTGRGVGNDNVARIFTKDGNATDPADFIGSSFDDSNYGIILGTTEATYTTSSNATFIDIVQDDIDEPDETFQICARIRFHTSDFCTNLTITDDDLAKVTGVTVTPGAEKVVITWNTVPRTNGYRIQWRKSNQSYNDNTCTPGGSGCGRSAIVDGGDTRKYTFEPTMKGDTSEFTFRVISIHPDEQGEPSDEKTARPGPPNNAPSVANQIPDQTATVGSDFNYTFPADTFSDPDGNTLTYSATNDPNTATWLSFDEDMRKFSGRPQTSDIGDVEVTVTADDGNGGKVDDTFTVTVVAANANPTITGPENTDISFAENGTGTVATFSASDPDNQDSITGYTLGGADASKFTITHPGGVLTFKTANTPDFEQPGSANNSNIYTVTVAANSGDPDADRDLSSDAITLTVTVTDENEAPVISIDEDEVDENTTDVGTVTATDVDADDTAVLSMTLGGVDAGKFTFSTTTGRLSFTDAPDYENPTDLLSTDPSKIEGNNEYIVTISATGGTGDRAITVPQTFTITVNPVNEKPTYSAIPAQTFTVGDSAATIDLDGYFSDPDGDTLDYSASSNDTDVAAVSLDNNDDTLLRITPSSTNTGTATITVTAADRATGVQDRMAVEGTFTVTVSPQAGATISSDPTTLDENNIDNADLVVDLTGVEYAASGTLSSSHFSIVPTPLTVTGLSVAQIQRNSDTQVRVTVSATNFDITSDITIAVKILAAGLTGDDDITSDTVTVGAIPDTAPTITTTTYDVEENNDTVAITAEDTDQDAGGKLDAITGFELTGSGADNDKFTIDDDGTLTFNTTPDYERPHDDDGNNKYEITLTVSSGETPRNRTSAVTSVMVRVTDDDEEAPGTITPNITASLTSLEVSWDAPTNTGPDITEYKVHWKESGGSYSSTERFATVTPPAATTHTIGNLNQNTQYFVCVRATNAEGTTPASLSDCSDVERSATTNNPPTFDGNPPSTITIPEDTGGGVDVGSPFAATTNRDGGQISFELSGSNLFTIAATGTNAGQISTTAGASFDHETTPSYMLTVTAKDGLGGRTEHALTIEIGDVNEPPAFPDAPYARSFDENTAANANVGAPVAATDPDGDTITYTLGGTDASSFTIDSASGQIKTVTAGVPYNYETKPSYSVTVQASSSGNPSVEVTVTITLNDLEEPPAAPAITIGTVTQTSIALSWLEPTNDGPPITDYDVQYREDTTPTWSDQTHDGTGLNTVITGLTGDTLYDIRVRAKNAETTDLNANWREIEQRTSDNAAPVFNPITATREFPENTAAGTDIGTPLPTATDTDTLSYSLRAEDLASFNFDANTRQLSTKSGVTYNFEDHAATPHYTVVMTADDNNGGTAQLTVDVNLINVNEPPTFPQASYTISFNEDAAADTAIGDPISAEDPDANETLQYTFTGSGTDKDAFNIDAGSGQIKTKAGETYNYESSKTSYSVTVEVEDGDGSTATVGVTINVVDVAEPPGKPLVPTVTEESTTEITVS